ncbi:polysaccharide biosynthesis tyrosine autokinase [Hymenobacter sp. BT186]|uniref:non-specific protein-tyrosine kinase n=1 Tax=Hymenobacter telluris TaxID=2816474 RepID=A0A939EU64_9BACT|nr:tyrosine-protein kinase [Hymenobacter telluris]MBO0357498.1 polysaccharide biosynthesis tyrosine autokinase [Hymenobacter telluris]MBW3373524.1 polysaccharide biosynthesis tyrosine autokinase [Hymenobacter norwichensis]
MATNELFPLRSEQPEAKDIKRIISQYTRFWYLFLLGIAISIAIAFLYLRYYAVPQYNVYSTLLIKDDKSGQSLANADALNDLSSFKSTRNIDNETEVIKSKSLMRRVVSELGLATSYYVEGRVTDKEIYGSGLPIKVIPTVLKDNSPGNTLTIYTKSNTTFELEDATGRTMLKYGQIITKPYGSFTVVATTPTVTAGTKIIVRFQNIQQIADYYSRAIGIQPINKNASILYLSLTDPIPEKAKDVVNKLMDVYNREAVEDKNLMATNTLKFLDERLQYITSDLSDVEKTVEKYKSSNNLTDVSTQASIYTEQASTYNTQLSEWAIQIEVLESIEKYLQKAGDQSSTVPSTLGIKDETLLGLIGQFNQLQLERERMLRTTQPGNPLVQNINEQLIGLRVKILENLRNIKRGLLITSNNLKSNVGQFQSKIRKVPGMERELLQINRQQSIKQSIYSYLLQKREETAISLAATASVARVLDPAMGGDYPISPNGQSIYLMAILLGLGIPFAGLYVASLLNNKVQYQQDVTAITDAPIIGEIAHNTQDTVVVTKGSRSPIAEMFRLVRANLNFVTMGKNNLTLLVTSGRSGEGKTFFSINLAASLAITGKRVVLLDLDLRNPTVAKKLHFGEGPGITDYLVSDTVSIEDIIQFPQEAPDLSVISAGSLPPNPAELMMSTKFTHLLTELKASFDYIIIDTPPVGQVADAFTISSLIDYTIYLVRYNYTQKAWLTIVKNIYRDKMLGKLMLVLNDAKEVNGSNYGYGYEYGYEFRTHEAKKQ